MKKFIIVLLCTVVITAMLVFFAIEMKSLVVMSFALIFFGIILYILAYDLVKERLSQNDISNDNIDLPLPLAYIKDGRMEILPYLDEARKDEIWGIVCDDLIVHTQKYFHRCWLRAVTLSNVIWLNVNQSAFSSYFCGKRITVPNVDDFKNICDHLDKFKETTDILREYGVYACCLDEVIYWTQGFNFYNTKDDVQWAYTFNIKTQEISAETQNVALASVNKLKIYTIYVIKTSA